MTGPVRSRKGCRVVENLIRACQLRHVRSQNSVRHGIELVSASVVAVVDKTSWWLRWRQSQPKVVYASFCHGWQRNVPPLNPGAV